MNRFRKLLITLLIGVGSVSFYYAQAAPGADPVYGTDTINTTDKVVITIDKNGKIEISGPNGSKPTKVMKVENGKSMDMLKITGGKPIKSLDSITIFSYNPTCFWIGGIVRCYNI